jgi:dynactin-5
MLRGDLVRAPTPGKTAGSVALAVGKYAFLSKGCTLKPPGRIYKGCVTERPALRDYGFPI